MVKLAPLAALAWIAACASPPPAAPGPTNTQPRAAVPEPGPGPAITGSCTAAEGGDSFGAMKNEVIGGLSLGLAEADVRTQLGDPAAVSDPVDNSAVGTWGWTWSYPDKGLELEMSAEKKTGPKTLTAITVGSGSPLGTRFGVGIGASTADVERAYGACLSKEESGADTMVAGTVYGGVLFSIEGGKVVGIFVGAAAE